MIKRQNTKTRSTAKSSELRIIAGRWRGRKISFPTHLSIRPTPNRVRETVFNWLAPYLNNSRCLDLYAGSGALGFEALSRGASKLVFIDTETAIIHSLEAQHSLLKIDAEDSIVSVDYLQTDALAYLSTESVKFDIIFLDPPYLQNRVPAILDKIISSDVMTPKGLIYIEMAKTELLPELPDNWQILKNKVMSQVACYVVQVF